MNSLLDKTVQNVLMRLHHGADHDMPRIQEGFAKGKRSGRSIEPEDMAEAYIAISREQGQLIYSLIRSTGAKNIIEFGTSFGISAIYLGAGARDNEGKVITTELLASKSQIARQNIKEAGLSQIITVVEGDALETLKNVTETIDFLFLDGWNNLYLPLLELLEPKFRTGTTIVTDNAATKSAQPFIQYVKNTPEKYVSLQLNTDKGATELSCYIK